MNTVKHSSLIHSGVPRLFDVEVPLPGLRGSVMKWLKRRVCGELNAAKGFLFWVKDGGGFAKTDLSAGGWLQIGRVYVRPDPGRAFLAARQGGDPVLLEAAPDAGYNFGKMQFAIETQVDEQGVGKAVFRIAWYPADRGWDLVLAPSKDRLCDVKGSERPVVAIVLDDIQLRSDRARSSKKPPRLASGLTLGDSPYLHHLAFIETQFLPSHVDVLAIDFGTHQTTLATWTGGGDRIAVHRHPMPWFYQAISLEFGPDHKVPGGLTAMDPVSDDFTLGISVKRLPGGKLKCPKPILAVRNDLHGEFDRLGFDSVSLKIPDNSRGHSLFKEIALGAECGMIVRRQPQLLPDLRPSPKLFLATIHNQSPREQSDLTCDQEVVSGFLREVFDSYATGVSMAQDMRAIQDGAPAQKREVRPILFSYPVSFTERQMSDLKQSFSKALKESTLHRFVQNQSELLAFADESTAAAMGVLFHEFGTLPMRMIADGYREFTTEPLGDRVEPMTLLCVDLGGGTSDLVLFSIDRSKSAEGMEVEVKEAFGFPRAGLVVTKEIGRKLKQAIVQHLKQRHGNLSDGAFQTPAVLNTNFEGVSLGQKRPTHLTERQGKTYQERRQRTQAWYDVAERIKRKLCDASCEKACLDDSDLALLGLQELQLTASEIVIERADLVRITRWVFAPAVKQARKWLGEHAVDLVVLSGRSFRLPGIRQRFEELFQEHNRVVQERGERKLGRPLRAQNIVDLNWLNSNYGLLDLYFNRNIDYDKALVPLGLLEKYNLQIQPKGGERVRVKEADNARRTRYIGLSAQRFMKESQHFQPGEVLFSADLGYINPQTDAKIIKLAPGTRRFYLLINFQGPGSFVARDDQDVEDCVDPARLLASADIFDDHPEKQNHEVEVLELEFRQRAATSVELARLIMRRKGQDRAEVVATPEKRENGVTTLVHDHLRMVFSENVILDDFRLDGRIDETDIDRDDQGGIGLDQRFS